MRRLPPLLALALPIAFLLGCDALNDSGEAKADDSKAGDAKADDAKAGDAKADDAKADEAADSKDENEEKDDDSDKGDDDAKSDAGNKEYRWKRISIDKVEPMGTQPPWKAKSFAFTGWGEEGKQFGLRGFHGYDMGALGGVDFLNLGQIHDTLSGQMIESYSIKRGADRDADKQSDLARMAKEAEKDKKWKARAGKLKKVKSSLESSDGKTVLSLEPARAPKGTKFELDKKKGNVFAYRWKLGDSQSKKGSLKLEVVAKTGKRERVLLDFGTPWGPKHLEAVSPDAEVVINGTVKVFWAPDDDKVVIIQTASVDGVHEEDPHEDARWFLRAIGPQVKVVNAGAGDSVARRAAVKIERNKIHVAAYDPDGKSVDTSEIYYRGEGGKELADEINDRLGATFPVKELEGSGWVDLIVLIGKDLK